VNFYSRTFALGAGVNAKTSNKTIENFSGGGPDRTRTCDLRFRKPLLYPAELRDQVVEKRMLSAGTVTCKTPFATEFATEAA
jgi:hypothetical protein